MSAADFYVVLEYNQASRQPEPDQHVTLFGNPEEAFELADDLTRENRFGGKRESYHVYGLAEVTREQDV